MLLLKGKVLEAMDNRGLATDCFKEALKHDVHCYEALDSLIRHQMLSVEEGKASLKNSKFPLQIFTEEEVINSLPISQQCNESEAEILQILYESKRKKYHTTVAPKLVKTKSFASKKLHEKIANSTPQSGLLSSTPGLITTPASLHTPNFLKENEKEQQTVGGGSATLTKLQDSLDLAVSEAERLYYNCDYQRCHALTEAVLKQDPYHYDCLPIHISCEVELKQSNSRVLGNKFALCF